MANEAMNRAAIALAVLVWIACGVLAYLVFRSDQRQNFGSWRVRDRRVGIFCFILGPVGLLGTVMTYLSSGHLQRALLKRLDSADLDRPAKW